MIIFSKNPAVLFLALIMVAAVNGEAIKLSGIVKNQSNKPVARAKIMLAGDSTITTTTDSGGSFTLSGMLTGMKPRIPGLAPSVALSGRYMRVILRNPSPVTISLYSVDGKSTVDFTTGTLNVGPTVLKLPVSGFAAGVYMMSVRYDGNRRIFRYTPLAAGENNARGFPCASNDAATLQKRSAVQVPGAKDTMFVKADGYMPYAYPVTSYDKSGIEIVLERVSRLDAITKSCDGLKPSASSGGKSGWGSRYWDCCKPHCSWPENTKNYAANCGADNSEIPCFKEVGNEYWTGLEGTKSGCEQGGEAYMCYRHVPFAVCKDLAYGFAAVPSGSDVCGKCFQLDFDGGFKHGTPKPAHALVKGKTMIVIASNIGHDVGGGQFDLMIPGGGLGAFREGCAKQWKVDVNNENLVGKGNGGFTSKCQEKLGWDADPEAIKSCVRSMCDELFGKDPSLRDLWEGCIWYVDWMHAVDNPTFTYKEVECPKALVDLYYSAYHPKP